MRVAVLLPQPYRGGSLKGTRDLCLLLRAAGAEPVCGLLADTYAWEQLAPFRAAGIPVRPTTWPTIRPEEAAAICRLHPQVEADPRAAGRWTAPHDAGSGFLDCDLWLVVSDRCPARVLPLRPVVALVYDCIQRYVPELFDAHAWRVYEGVFREQALDAWRVLATTPPTLRDLIDFAGVPARRTRLLPVHYLPPESDAEDSAVTPSPPAAAGGGVLWLSNAARHKNHLALLDGLEEYWAGGGRLGVTLAGVETGLLAGGSTIHYHLEVQRRIAALGRWRSRLRVVGELPESAFRRALRGATALLHGARADNGTFAVIDAGICGTPALSSDYPQMRHLAETFALAPRWFAADDPAGLAARLHEVEADPQRVDPAPVRAAIARQRAAAVAALRALLAEVAEEHPPRLRREVAHA
jgi:glycosyltransferase involved in cell wall biosynthesis